MELFGDPLPLQRKGSLKRLSSLGAQEKKKLRVQWAPCVLDVEASHAPRSSPRLRQSEEDVGRVPICPCSDGSHSSLAGVRPVAGQHLGCTPSEPSGEAVVPCCAAASGPTGASAPCAPPAAFRYCDICGTAEGSYEESLLHIMSPTHSHCIIQSLLRPQVPLGHYGFSGSLEACSLCNQPLPTGPAAATHLVSPGHVRSLGSHLARHLWSLRKALVDSATPGAAPPAGPAQQQQQLQQQAVRSSITSATVARYAAWVDLMEAAAKVHMPWICRRTLLPEERPQLVASLADFLRSYAAYLRCFGLGLARADASSWVSDMQCFLEAQGSYPEPQRLPARLQRVLGARQVTAQAEPQGVC